MIGLPLGLTSAAILVTLAAVASAQDPETNSKTSVDQELATLREDYSELVLRLSELEGRNGIQDDGTEVADTLDDEVEGGDGLYFRSGYVDGTFLIFGDAEASYENPEVGGNSEFTMGALVVLGSVNLGEHFRVLSETVIETDQIGQERLWGQYIVDDALYLKLGTEHSPIARWNYEFHHGAWLETTITRPILDRFEGGNGIIPMHRTGLEVGGRVITGGGSLQYFATLSNGRGGTPKDKQREGDENDSKAIDVGINYFPASSPNMTFGGAITYDEIPADSSVAHPDRSHDMTEWIGTANFSSAFGAFFLRSEYAFIMHDGRTTDTDYKHTTGFLQLELPGEQWTPYARWGYRNMDEGDPFYSPLDRDLDESRQVLGVRNDFHSNVAVKFEVSYGRRDERNGSDISGDNVTTAGIQLSWTF